MRNSFPLPAFYLTKIIGSPYDPICRFEKLLPAVFPEGVPLLLRVILGKASLLSKDHKVLANALEGSLPDLFQAARQIDSPQEGAI